MRPAQYKNKFITRIVERSGICRATAEVVVQAVFDELRYQMTEGAQVVPIESFGTFAVKETPERQHLYTYKGKTELRTYAATRQVKFRPCASFRHEVEAGKYNHDRQSFVRHPGDPRLYKRHDLQYRKQGGFYLQRPDDAEESS